MNFARTRTNREHNGIIMLGRFNTANLTKSINESLFYVTMPTLFMHRVKTSQGKIRNAVAAVGTMCARCAHVRARLFRDASNNNNGRKFRG